MSRLHPQTLFFMKGRVTKLNRSLIFSRSFYSVIIVKKSSNLTHFNPHHSGYIIYTHGRNNYLEGLGILWIMQGSTETHNALYIAASLSFIYRGISFFVNVLPNKLYVNDVACQTRHVDMLKACQRLKSQY